VRLCQQRCLVLQLLLRLVKELAVCSGSCSNCSSSFDLAQAAAQVHPFLRRLLALRQCSQQQLQQQGLKAHCLI
jgi:hypothetical protein